MEAQCGDGPNAEQVRILKDALQLCLMRKGKDSTEIMKT
jgi:hypothetical protein